MAMDKASDRSDLVGRIRRGDRQAETELVERYKRVVISIIRRALGNFTVADDLYQETFCIIIEKIVKGDVREAERLTWFVCGVARNQVIKHFQRAARQERLTETGEVVSLPSPAHDQLEELLRKESADIVRQILKEM